MFLIMTIVCGLLVSSSAYPTGAPKEACKKFTAQHEDHTAQNSKSNYEITMSSPSVAPGGIIIVTIKGVEKFKGYLIQGTVANSNSSIGEFKPKAGVSQTLECQSKADSATHVSAFSENGDNKVELEWQAPDTKASVVFRAVVVQTFEIFWDNLRSGVLTVG